MTVTVPSDADGQRILPVVGPAVAERAERVARTDRLLIDPLKSSETLPGTATSRSVTLARTGVGDRPSACITANDQSWLTSVTSSPKLAQVRWPRYRASSRSRPRCRRSGSSRPLKMADQAVVEIPGGWRLASQAAPIDGRRVVLGVDSRG